jgi:phosphoglycerate kinase
MVEEARAILSAAEGKCEIVLPVDCVIAQGPDQPPRARPLLFEEESVPDGWAIFDIGPKTVGLFMAALEKTDVLIWNGPVGLFEREAFAGGTRELARKLAALDARTIVCGGETVQAVREAGVAESMNHLSTGGGAALELLEGRTLPGVAALSNVTEGADATSGAKMNSTA